VTENSTFVRMLRALTFGLTVFGTSETFAYEDKRFGFGKQRLTSVKGKGVHVQADSECPNVSEFRYTEAVIDNFASLNEQKFWDGEGQRYWLNEEFWGGPGYPVFVFIGGEWVESCYRLTSSVRRNNFSLSPLLYFSSPSFSSSLCLSLLLLSASFSNTCTSWRRSIKL
jgi:hypothetical protein